MDGKTLLWKKVIRLLYYLPMERMADYKPQERQDLEELYRKQNVRIYELEQENKKLNDKIAHLEFDIEAWRQLKSVMEWGIEELVEDYKALWILNDEIRRVNENLREDKKKLKEKVRFLEECLDNKEKVNKSLREELSAYDREYFDEDKKAKNIFIDNSWKVIKGWEFTTLC